MVHKTRFKAFWLTFLVLLVCLYTPVFGVPPVTSVQQFTEGYVIKVPQDNILKVGQDYDFEFHIYNISNGIPILDANCTFHLYNNTGKHLYTESIEIVNHTFDYGFFVDGGNFTLIGDYYYNIQCESLSDPLGGFSSSSLMVTGNGKDRPEGIVIILFCSIFLIILGGLLLQLILNLGHLASLDLDVIDLAKSMGLYFMLLGAYQLSIYYLGNLNIESLMLIFILVGGFTHIIIPIIGFLFSITIGSLKKKKADFGTKRIYKRTKIG